MAVTWQQHIENTTLTRTEMYEVAARMRDATKDCAAQVGVDPKLGHAALSFFDGDGLGKAKEIHIQDLILHTQQSYGSGTPQQISDGIFRLITAGYSGTPHYQRMLAAFDAEQFPVMHTRLLWSKEQELAYMEAVDQLAIKGFKPTAGNFQLGSEFPFKGSYKLSLPDTGCEVTVWAHSRIVNGAFLSISPKFKPNGIKPIPDVKKLVDGNIEVKINGSIATPLLRNRFCGFDMDKFPLGSVMEYTIPRGLMVPSTDYAEPQTPSVYAPIDIKIEILNTGEIHSLTIDPIPPMTEIPGMGGAFFIGMPVALR